MTKPQMKRFAMAGQMDKERHMINCHIFKNLHQDVKKACGQKRIYKISKD